MRIEERFAHFTDRDWQREPIVDPVRIAVVGLGGFAVGRALPAIKSTEFCECTVLVSGNPAKAAKLGDKFAVDTCIDYESFHDGEAADKYDAVYIATPNATHLEFVETAVRFDKHTLVEKPLETTVEKSERVVEICRDAGVTLMTAYRLQLEPTVRRTRELIDDGFIGDPVAISGTFGNRILDSISPRSWRFDPALAGGGALFDLGIYPLNTVRFLLNLDPVGVCAMTSSITEPFTAVDERVVAQLQFPHGIASTCTASINAHPNSHLHLVGTHGQIRIDAPFGGIVPHKIVAERGDMLVEYTGPPVDEVVEEFEYFAYCIRTQTSPEPDGYDGRKDVQIITAAYDSAESERHHRISLKF